MDENTSAITDAALDADQNQMQVPPPGQQDEPRAEDLQPAVAAAEEAAPQPQQGLFVSVHSSFTIF